MTTRCLVTAGLALLAAQPVRGQSADAGPRLAEELMRTVQLLDERFRLNNTAIAELRAALARPDPNTEAIARLEETVRTNNQAIRNLQVRRDELVDRVAALEGRVASLQGQVNASQGRLTALEREVARLSEELNRRPAPPAIPMPTTRPVYTNPLYTQTRSGLPISSYSPVFGSAATHYRNSMP